MPRNIETLAVVRDDQVIFENVLLELVEVHAVDVMINGSAVIQSDRCNFIAGPKSCGFDIEKCS